MKEDRTGSSGLGTTMLSQCTILEGKQLEGSVQRNVQLTGHSSVQLTVQLTGQSNVRWCGVVRPGMSPSWTLKGQICEREVQESKRQSITRLIRMK